jgi:hypothetical protein
MKAAEGKSTGSFSEAYRLIAIFRVTNPDYFFSRFRKNEPGLKCPSATSASAKQQEEIRVIPT